MTRYGRGMSGSREPGGQSRGPRRPWLQVQILFLQPHDHKLSDQREALSHGQNPLPIYCALNTKEKGLTTFEFGGEQPWS